VPARYAGTPFHVRKGQNGKVALRLILWIYQELPNLGGDCECVLSETAGAGNGLILPPKEVSQHRRVKDKGRLSTEAVALRF
jgi:hypothetical protein